MFHFVKKIDRWLHSHLALLLLLLFLIILRIPNFFEPYWYGDEGIYLTVGNALRDGEKLYTQIVDHKTPLIYYLATVPNQFSFRVLTLAWMMIATTAFYGIGKKLFKSMPGLIISSLIFVLLTSLPWFEGNIPNGELFVMGFVLVGAWLLTKTHFFELFLKPREALTTSRTPIKLYLSGCLFGLAILTKVPALLDAVAWMAIAWFALTNQARLLTVKKSRSEWGQLVKQVLGSLSIFIGGMMAPIVASMIYYLSLGSGGDYLQFGLLYNFRYASNWQLPFSSLILQKIFTLQGKFAITTLIILFLSYKKKWFSPRFQLIATWFMLALFASLLSNRPYPHYFQQLLPAWSLLVGLVIQEILQKKSTRLPTVLTTFILGGLATGALILLKFGAYPTVSYYQRFYQLATKQISPTTYRNSFNYLMKDNYQAAKIIKQSEVKEIFIWGTNPMLYALSHTQPTGRFTVSFHIKDFNAYQETMDSIYQKKPLFIIVMDDETSTLPGLDAYLDDFYVMNTNFENFSLWKRLPEKISFKTL